MAGNSNEIINLLLFNVYVIIINTIHLLIVILNLNTTYISTKDENYMFSCIINVAYKVNSKKLILNSLI